MNILGEVIRSHKDLASDHIIYEGFNRHVASWRLHSVMGVGEVAERLQRNGDGLLQPTCETLFALSENRRDIADRSHPGCGSPPRSAQTFLRAGGIRQQAAWTVRHQARLKRPHTSCAAYHILGSDARSYRTRNGTGILHGVFGRSAPGDQFLVPVRLTRVVRALRKMAECLGSTGLTTSGPV